jgi:type I restriction enzyme, S subunit
VEYANLGSGGTRMPRTDWGSLKNYPISIPDIKIINRFNKLALPSIEKITSNLKQIHTLEKLRDTLLPKLMSGEVRVAL